MNHYRSKWLPMPRLLWIIIISSICSAEERFGFHPLDSLVGQVKNVKETKCKAREKKDGQITVRKTFCSYKERQYRQDGLIIADSLHENGYAHGWTRYYYDGNSRLVRRRRQIPGAGFVDEMRYRYDPWGNCIEESNYDAAGRLDDSRKLQLTCDARGRVIESIETDEDGRFVERCTDIRYDDQGNTIARIIIDDDGDTGRETMSYHYYGNGLIVKVIKFDGKSQDWARTYRHTANGTITSITKTAGNEEAFDDCDSFTLDGNGRLIEYVDYDDDRSVQRRMSGFTYDMRGNWISALYIDDDDDLFLIERKITYY